MTGCSRVFDMPLSGVLKNDCFKNLLQCINCSVQFLLKLKAAPWNFWRPPLLPVDTRRRFNVYKTSIRSHRRRIDVLQMLKRRLVSTVLFHGNFAKPSDQFLNKDFLVFQEGTKWNRCPEIGKITPPNQRSKKIEKNFLVTNIFNK